MHAGSDSAVLKRPLGATPAWAADRNWSADTAILFAIALATVVVHLLTGGAYGFHRDELATLDDARHLAWGYVAYPPVTPFFGRLSLTLFGTSLTGFRFFAALAEAIAVVLTGLMARELGGGRKAQLIAAAAAVPFCLAGGALMQYVSFDYLWWVLTAYFVVRLLSSCDPRWWVAIGSAIGVGLLTKYSILVLAFGVAVGVLLTDRRHFRTKWLWLGVAASLLIFVPNFIWQLQHHFVSLDFLRHIHERDVRIGRTKNFLPDQLELTLFALPLALAGVYFYFTGQGRRFRLLGWMYIVPLLVFVIAKGRGYYLAAAYPMLYAAGSVCLEQWLASRRRPVRITVEALIVAALAANVVITAAITLPLARPGSRWWAFASRNNGDLVEEIGWPELVEEVARIRDSLPSLDRPRLGILAGNYGEAGAINLYGPRHSLPTAISGVNSFWQRGYGNPPPDTLIVLGFSKAFMEGNFAECRLAGHVSNPFNVENEESRDHPDIFVCRGLRQSWDDFWKGFQRFG
jgi:Dolichyl-phosphate-mannose-protein mannosyltransferase